MHAVGPASTPVCRWRAAYRLRANLDGGQRAAEHAGGSMVLEAPEVLGLVFARS